MSRFLTTVRWADVVVGAVVWGLLFGEWLLLEWRFPMSPPDCVETSPFSCWDLRAPMVALLSAPVWYVVWVALLRPCPWPLRWVTPLAVSAAAYRLMELGPHSGFAAAVLVIAVGYVVPAAVMAAVNGTVAGSSSGRRGAPHSQDQ